MGTEEATNQIIGLVPVVVSMKILDSAMKINKRKPVKIKHKK